MKTAEEIAKEEKEKLDKLEVILVQSYLLQVGHGQFEVICRQVFASN